MAIEAIFQTIKKIPKTGILFLGILLVAIIGSLDYLTGYLISFLLF